MSLNGLTSCCSIVSVGTVEVAKSSGTAAASAGGNFSLPTPTSLMIAPASVTGGASPTGTVKLTATAPQGGIQIELKSNNAAVATVPQRVMVAAGASTGTFTVSTKPIPLERTGNTLSDAPVPVLISASGASSKSATTFQTVTQTATLDVLPPIVENLGGYPPSALSVTSVTAQGLIKPCAGTNPLFNQTGGTPTQACVQLSGPAADEPQGRVTPLKVRGAGVALSSSNPQIATVPPTVIVPVSQQAEQFAVTSVPVRTPTTVVLSAHRTNSDAKSVQLTVLPPQLQDFACNPNSVIGDESVTCTLGLSGPAYDGLTLPLQYSTTRGIAGSSPTSLPVAREHSSANFTILTSPVVADVNVTISASLGGLAKSVPLAILAPRPIHSLAVRVITADGPAAAAFSDDVYFSIGPLGWKLARWTGDLWGWRSFFEDGSDYTLNLDITNDLTTDDILLLGLEKKGVGGLYNAPDSPGGAWKPHKVTLYVDGAPYPNDSCCLVDQSLAQGHGLWTLQLHHFDPYGAEQVFLRSLRLSANPPLTQVSETLGYLTTKFGKDRNISGWLPDDVSTNCVTGTLIRSPAVSTDGLATIDLQVEKMEEMLPSTYHVPVSSTPLKAIQRPQVVPPLQTFEFILDGNHGIAHTRFLRIEYAYGGQITVGGGSVISEQGGNPLPQNNQRVRICGDVYRDMDYENWFEIHPRSAADVMLLAPPSPSVLIRPKR